MELTEPLIHTVRNGIFPSNTYLLQSDLNKCCLIIDPGLDTEKIEIAIDQLNLMPIAILATHGHFDHIASVSYFKKKYNIPFYLHEADLKISQSANFYLKIAKINFKIDIPFPDYLFKGFTEKITIQDFTLTIYNFIGHSNGSSIIQYRNFLFSGDIIYKKGMYFNNFPGENRIRLKESLILFLKMFSKDKSTLIFPGHGEPALLDHIKMNNLELIDFIKNDQ